MTSSVFSYIFFGAQPSATFVSILLVYFATKQEPAFAVRGVCSNEAY